MEMFISMQAMVAKMCEHMEKEFRKELQDQGHKLTGKLISSIRSEVQEMQTAVEGLIYFEDYYTYLETGVSPSRIPYGGNRGSGSKTSKYITALIDYWQMRGKSGREARSAAFATANKHRQEGMPTKSSYSFSKNNRRTGFMSHVSKNSRSVLEQMLEQQGQKAFQLAMLKILRDNIIAA